METVTDPIPPNNGANRGGTITKDKKDNLAPLTTTRISSDIGYRLTNLPRVVYNRCIDGIFRSNARSEKERERERGYVKQCKVPTPREGSKGNKRSAHGRVNERNNIRPSANILYPRVNYANAASTICSFFSFFFFLRVAFEGKDKRKRGIQWGPVQKSYVF